MVNSAFSLLSLFCRLLGSSLVFIVIARLPGITVGDFGQLTYATALTGLFILASQFGFAPLIVRDVAADASLLQSHARCMFALRIIFSAVGLGLLAAYIHWIDMSGQGRMICGIIGVAFYLGSFSIDIQVLFQSQERLHLELVGIAIENALLVALVIPAYYLNFDAIGVACIFLITKSVALLANYVLCGRYLIWLCPAFQWTVWKKLLKDGAPFAIAAVLALGIVQFDTILLRELSPGNPEESVGIYQAAVRLFLVPMLLPQIVLKVFLPQLSRMHGQSGHRLASDLGRVNHVLLTLGVLIGIVTYFRGQDIVTLFYGSKLAAAGPLLKLMGVTIVMRFGAAYNLYFTIRDRAWFRVGTSLIGLLAVVVLDAILIPKYGPMGAAYASIAAHVIYWLPYLAAMFAAERSVLLGWRILRAAVAGAAIAAILQATAPLSLIYMLPVYGALVLVAVFCTLPAAERGGILSQLHLKGI
jgi:PST family polysaccharide transporter